MQKPPRPREHVAGATRCVQGAIVLVALLAVYEVSRSKVGKQVAFTVMVFASLPLFLRAVPLKASRVAAAPKNPALWLVVGGTLAMLGVVLFVPLLRDLFKFGVCTRTTSRSPRGRCGCFPVVASGRSACQC